MSSRVDQPSEVENNAVAKCAADKESIPEILTPAIACDLSRHDEAHVECEPWVKLLLENNERILQQVGKVHATTSLDNVGVLLHQEPSHVSIEESASSIVGVSISLTVFVVHAVIPSPMVNSSLVGN